MKGVEKQFRQTPIGANAKRIPVTKCKKSITTLELVKANEPDASFFRQLEQQGIYLNAEQLQAVRTTEGPLLCLAGAGSGKTRVLISRTAYILKMKDIHPSQILLLSFTKKAADEMKERILKFEGLNELGAQNIRVGTFHSIFLRLLRNQGFNQKILTSERYKQSVIRRILRSLNLTERYDEDIVLATISNYKSKGIRVEELSVNTKEDKEFQQIYYHFEQWKSEQRYMDFDDILVYAYQLLKQDDALVKRIQNQVKYCMMDEFQDINAIQYELLSLIVNSHQPNIMVSGDEDQTIFGFRNSNPDYITKRFSKDYPNVQQVMLTQNYRSNSFIVGLGNEILRFNKNRLGKVCVSSHTNGFAPCYLRPTDTQEEARKIVDNIERAVQEGHRSYKDIAILYRVHSVSRAILDELIQRGIPFESSLKETFYEHKLVKPVLAHLRLAANPYDVEAVMDILPTLFISKEKGDAWLKEQLPSDSKKNPLLHLLNMPGLTPNQHQKVFERIAFIRGIVKKSPSVAVRDVRFGQPRYEPYLEMNGRTSFTTQRHFIAEMLDELETSAQPFQTISEYINFVQSIVQHHNTMIEEDIESEDHIRLLTIHASKGLEFPVVYVIGFSEGIMPQKSAIVGSSPSQNQTIDDVLEEERRLAYVSVSRAKEELYLSSVKTFRNKEVNVSRFLLEPFMDAKD